MVKEIISKKEGIAITLLFILDGSVIIPVGNEAGKDIWIGVIIATILGVLASLMYFKILSSFPGKDLFDISEKLFGKVFGKVVNLLYVWFAFHLSSLILSDYVQFIATVTLPETNQLIVVIFPAVLCIWGLKLGIEALGRFSNLVIVPTILLMVIAILLLIPKMSLNNLLPVVENGIQPIFSGTFSLFAFPFGETVILMAIFNCFRDSKSISNIYIISIILGGSFILLGKISEIAVLGINPFKQYYFPSYMILKRVDVSDFIKRIEIINGLIFSVGGLVKLSVCMLAVCKGISKIFSFDDYRFLVTPLVILDVDFMFISSKNIVELFSFVSIAWRYYAFPFEVILPLIMLILTLLKKKTHDMLQEN